MKRNDRTPGADAPGEKTGFSLSQVEQEPARKASVRIGNNVLSTQISLRKRQAEAVIDPVVDAGTPATEAPTMDHHLPPETLVQLLFSAGQRTKERGKRFPRDMENSLGEALPPAEANAPVMHDWATRIGVLPHGGSNRAVFARHDVFAAPHSCPPLSVEQAVAFARHLREQLAMQKDSKDPVGALGRALAKIATRASTQEEDTDTDESVAVNSTSHQEKPS